MSKIKPYDEFTRLYEHLTSTEPGSKEYGVMLEHIQRFDLIFKKEKKMDKLLNNPALLNLIGTSFGLALVLYHERGAIITSRAFTWLKFR